MIWPLWTMNRSTSSEPTSTVNVAREACAIVTFSLTLAVDGSFGLSWWTTSSFTIGWLSPNASALKPARSMPALNVTSNAPAPVAVCCVDRRGLTDAPPTVGLERHVELAAVEADLVQGDRAGPPARGAVTRSDASAGGRVERSRRRRPCSCSGSCRRVEDVRAPNGARSPPNSW